MLLWMGGFTLSACLTASGMLKSYRSGMHVWIGKGMNQARTLLLGMLIVGFVFVVLGPMAFGEPASVIPVASTSRRDVLGALLFVGCWFLAPVAILLVLERDQSPHRRRPSRQVRPKVPTVGKWGTSWNGTVRSSKVTWRAGRGR